MKRPLDLSVLLVIVGNSLQWKSSSAENPEGCVTNFDPAANVDYFPDKSDVSNSVHWTIEYFNTYKVIQNNFVNETYLLYQCGTPIPESVNVEDYNVVTSIPPPDGVAMTTTVESTTI
jgi:iron complex transport system substrate-binding protein